MADERIITLSEEDVIILKEVIAEVMRMRENPTLRTAQPIEDGGYGASPSTLKAIAMETGTGYIRFDVMQDVRGATIRANQVISANATMPVTAGSIYFLQRDARGAWGVSYGQVTIQNNGALVGTEPIINFIGASSITDDLTNTRVTVTVSSGGGSLEIKDVTGTPDYTGVSGVVIDIAGSSLSQPSSGIAKLTLPVASVSQVGVMDTSTQELAGYKKFRDGISVADSSTGTPYVTFESAGATLQSASYIGWSVPGTGNVFAVQANSIDLFSGHTYLDQLSISDNVWIFLSSFNGSGTDPQLNVKDHTGTLNTAQYAVVSGLTFVMGLYCGGSLTISAVAWSAITGTPTNLVGYGVVVSPPASSTDTGTEGQISYDSGFFYICRATNVWMRFPKDASMW